MTNQEIFGRRKLVRVPYTRLLQLLVMSAERQTYVMVPHCVGLPGDVTVLGIQFDAESDSALFVVCHESFSVTPEGAKPEEIEVVWTMVELERPEGQDSRERGR